MSDAWTVVTVKPLPGAELPKLEKVEKKWDEWVEDVFDDLGGWDTVAGNDNEYCFQGWSKYEPSGIGEFAERLTKKRPVEVTYTLEWHGEGGPSIEETTWRGGEALAEESKVTALIRVQRIRQLIQALEHEIDVARVTAEGDSNDAEIGAWQQVGDTAEALLAVLKEDL